ncbi:MAG: malate dehydrogenase [Planctomycetota bacterium]
MSKVSVIGAGYVGEAAAKHLAQREVGEVFVFDILEDMPRGKALDLMESAPVVGFDSIIHGVNVNKDGDGSEYKHLAGSEVIILTSGIPRKPGMSRDDLLKINAGIVSGVVDNIKKYAPDSKLIVVTNPLDVMSMVAYIKLGWDRSRVMGMAGVLDSARMAWFIAEAVPCSVQDVRAMVLGGHGDTMVPLPRFTTVSGIPVTELLPAEKLKAINERTAKGGGEIVNLFRNASNLGSAYHAPGISAAIMAESIVRNQKRILPTCCYLDGEYGEKGLYQGVPAVLGKNGVEKVIDLKLNADEKALWDVSVSHVKKSTEEMRALLGI